MTEFNTVDEILRILKEDLGIKDENIDTKAVEEFKECCNDRI